MLHTYHRTMDFQQNQSHLDFKYPHSCYTTTCHTSTVRNSYSDVCGNSRGDPPFPDSSVQMGRIASAYTYEAARYRDSAPTISIEEMQMRLKLLEDRNAAMHLRNQNLIAENRNLTNRLKEDTIKIDKLQENMSLLQDELNNEKIRLTDLVGKQMKNDEVCLEDECISSTNIVPMIDRGIQIWETCRDCHGVLEGCQREPPTVTITKSEFELLERDMRTLRDAAIAREEAWDKAMEREQNCRQQLARLTAEAITARHLCETRQDELHMITDILTEKEMELKMMQKETLYLNKLIAKLHQKVFGGYASGDVSFFSISEKDQKCIEEIVRRVRSIKSKSKSKSNCKYTSDKCSNSSSCHGSPRKSDNGKDRAGSSEDHRN